MAMDIYHLKLLWQHWQCPTWRGPSTTTPFRVGLGRCSWLTCLTKNCFNPYDDDDCNDGDDGVVYLSGAQGSQGEEEEEAEQHLLRRSKLTMTNWLVFLSFHWFHISRKLGFVFLITSRFLFLSSIPMRIIPNTSEWNLSWWDMILKIKPFLHLIQIFLPHIYHFREPNNVLLALYHRLAITPVCVWPSGKPSKQY